MNGPGQLIDASETGVVECLALEDAEPNLDLIEPTGAGWGEVKGDIGVGGKPVFVSFVGVEVVKDDVDLPSGWGTRFPLRGSRMSSKLGRAAYSFGAGCTAKWSAGASSTAN